MSLEYESRPGYWAIIDRFRGASRVAVRVYRTDAAGLIVPPAIETKTVPAKGARAAMRRLLDRVAAQTPQKP